MNKTNQESGTIGKGILAKYANIMKEYPNTRFYRIPKTLHSYCLKEGQNKSLVDCLVSNKSYYEPICSTKLNLNDQIVAEYTSNTGEMSLLYLKTYSLKKLISYEIEKGAIAISTLLKNEEGIKNWELVQANLLKDPVDQLRDTTILQDPFTYDNYYNLSEEEYVNSCIFMVKNALKHTAPGGRFIVMDHGPDIIDYATLKKCPLGENRPNVILNTEMEAIIAPEF